MTLIDLGELRDDVPPPPAARRRPGHRAWRFLAVLAVALLTLAASLPPAGRDLVVVPSRLGADRFVAEGLLLVVDPRTPQESQRSMTAYRLPAAEPVWRAPLPVEGEFWGGTARGDVLLVTGYSPQEGSSATVALDLGTGERRWQRPGSAVDLADGNVLLEEFNGDGPRTLRAVNSCCGTPRWEIRLPAGEVAYRYSGHGMDRLVTSDDEGRVEVRDTGTGTVLAAADLGATGDGRWTQVVGDLVLVFAGAPPVATAYGLDRLDRRWQAALPGTAFATDCGGPVCVQSRSGGVRALDAATGRLLWTLDGRNELWTIGDHVILVRIGLTGTGRPDLAVLDPSTGRVRAELGRWELARSPSVGDPLIAVRPHPGRGLFVAELDVAAGVVRPLDVLPGAAGDCEVAGDHLLCRRHDASLGLWPLRR